MSLAPHKPIPPPSSAHSNSMTVSTAPSQAHNTSDSCAQAHHNEMASHALLVSTIQSLDQVSISS